MERFGPVGSFVSFEECRSILPWLVLVLSDRSEAAMLESVKTKKTYHNNNDKNFAGKRHGGHATPFEIQRKKQGFSGGIKHYIYPFTETYSDIFYTRPLLTIYQ